MALREYYLFSIASPTRAQRKSLRTVLFDRIERRTKWVNGRENYIYDCSL